MTTEPGEIVEPEDRWDVHLYEPACDPGGAEFIDNVVALTRADAIRIVTQRAEERWPGAVFAVWRAERASDASEHSGSEVALP